ncbi:MAG: dihydroorotate dehydrogenase-like protein [Candidatus Aminicenantes bacterium]|nr:dihydroorotate dehydrogenase-like protein [Candidatus Aminicenantes bacterium]
MADLRVSYMGLSLKNPVVVSSSDLTRTLDGIKKCEDSGAGAVVLKSIFEEQFLIEGGIPESDYAIYPEALDYMRSGSLLEYAPHDLTRLIEDAKREAGIPIIASINCQTPSLWPRFARQIQEAGADALELNISYLPIKLSISGKEYEDHHLNILRAVKKEVSIPVSVKLMSCLTSVPHLGQRLADAGCAALVLFNWFLQPDIDIDKLKTRSRIGKGELSHSLRWVGLCSGRVECDIAASGGIQNAEDAIKQLLAGASIVQICTLFMQKGLGEIRNILKFLEEWMAAHDYARIDDFRGEMSFKRQELTFRDLGEAAAYFRAQYLKVYSKK